MAIRTTLEDYIHILAEWENSRIVRTTQVPTYVMDKLRVSELASERSHKNQYPAQENFEHRALTWFEIEQMEDITLK